MMKGHGGKCSTSMCGWILVIIGAINWGLIGIGGFLGGDWNVVGLIFGGLEWLENIIYILVGLAGVMMLFGCKCKKCKGGDCGGCGMCRSCKAGMEKHEEKEHHE